MTCLLKRLAEILVLLTPATCFAQSTTVTLSVTDTPDSQTWNNGTYQTFFVGAQTPSWPGGAVTITGAVTALSSSGTASFSLPDNNTILPSGTQWRIQVCSATLPARCFSQTQTITGASQTVALTPQSPRFTVPTTPQVVAPISAYATGEISGGWVGFQFYLLGTGIQVCSAVSGSTCTTWTTVGGAATSFSTNVVDAVTFGAKFDGVIYYDVTTTNTSPTVTCPNSDCAFTSAMVNRPSWVVNNNGCSAAAQCTPIIGTVGSAPPTVVSVASANSITLSANANAGCAAACAIIVADYDTASISAAYTTASQKCGMLQLPAGITITKTAQFSDPSGTSTCSIFAAVGSRQSTTVKGFGSTSTIIVPSIDFDMTTCTATFGGGQPGGACFGQISANAHGTVLQGFTIYGMGLNMGASANNKVGIALGTAGNNYTIDDVQLMHWNAGSTGSVGLYIAGGTTILEKVEVDGFNNTPCAVGGSNALLHGNYFCGDSPGPALNILNTNSVLSTYGGQYCSTGNPVVALSAGATWSSFNEQFEPPICGAFSNQKAFNGSTGTISLVGASVTGTGASDIGISFTGGSYSMLNTVFNESGAGAACFNTAGSPSWIDLGGNTVTCSTLLAAGSGGVTIIADGHSVKAVCTGVATSSSTLALISTGTSLTGTALTTACTGTTLDKGIAVNGARTLKNFTCSSSATTVSVACTVMTSHNGAAFASSGITCTMTAATFCSDGTHTLTVADGDFVTVQIVTGAAETGANIKSIVEWN